MASSHVKGVLDLTFLDIKDESDLQNSLHSDRVLSIPLATTSPSNSPTRRRKQALEEVKAIRLANNEISLLQHIISPISNFIDTTKITWLDLSFNHIERLDLAIFTVFPNVTTLYLQANHISKLSEVKKLEGFPNLKSLAMYGNPIEEHKHYRNYVLLHCKSMVNFDMSPVTKSERTMVSTGLSCWKC